MGLLLVGGLGALAGGRPAFLVVTFGLGGVTLLVARRSWAKVSSEGLEICPNGLRVVRARWDEVVSIVGRRVVLADGTRVTVPPLAGDPLAHVRTEYEHRMSAGGPST